MGITRIDYGERDGDYKAGESDRVAFLRLTTEDGRKVTIRAMSCSCCGGAGWAGEDISALGRVFGVTPSEVSE